VRKIDADLRLFYTADTDSAGAKLGAIAIVLGSGKRTVWRFGDDIGGAIDFANARRGTG
jgi:hypothetical protein